MLTRLRVNGFKNLIDVDVRFGPFTCVAGANGVGKSNLFDAIMFLSALAEKTLIEAAMSVRGEGGRAIDVRHLFHRAGNEYDDTMSFEAEMIIPATGVDDYGQQAQASITSLRYRLDLEYRQGNGDGTQAGLKVIHEELAPIKLGDKNKKFLFPHDKSWSTPAISGRRVGLYISTEARGSVKIIHVHQDSGGGKKESWPRGRGRSFPAEILPRTALSSATNAAENPTALLVRREMQSWRLLQLEPTALRQYDEITAPRRLGADGSHLPATLYRLAGNGQNSETIKTDSTEDKIYSEVASRLSELIDDVHEVRIDRDEKRETLTLEVMDSNGTKHPARSLSDGTLRFLALTVLGMDSEEQGLLCLEEPENGIHPERIPAMLRLLKDIATNTNEAIGPDNPLSQVIINTHSPAVVSQVPDESLLIAELKETLTKDKKRFRRVQFSCLPGNWRSEKAPGETTEVSKGKLLAYLTPALPERDEEDTELNAGKKKSKSGMARRRRVIDRDDIQPWLFPRK
jgi:predicted ATPase